MDDPTRRFHDRVADYRRHRPDYPPALVAWLAARVAPDAARLVADVGSGTGLFAAQLLAAGYRVAGVEPDPAMRAAAEEDLAGAPGWTSVAGRAEATTLAAASVDLVTAAQAFHWFDVEATRAEWRRILRPGGWVALVWNELDLADPAMAALEAATAASATDTTSTRRRAIAASCGALLWQGAPVEVATFPHGQRLMLDGLIGRAASASFLPKAGAPGHEALCAALRGVFDRHATPTPSPDAPDLAAAGTAAPATDAARTLAVRYVTTATAGPLA